MSANENNGFHDSLLFQDLPRSDVEELTRHATVKRYRKNTIVISHGDQGDSLFLIKRGTVRVYLDNEQGDELTLLKLGPGEAFGELALLSDGPRTANVITTEECEIAVLSKDAFLKCLRNNPEMSLHLIQILVAKVQSLTENMSSIALLDVYGRIANVLTKQATEEDGKRITDKMTHQDLANLVGASREMVSRILKDLRAGGYISIRDKRIILERDLPSAW